MILAGQHLYKVSYKILTSPKLKEVEFTRLVVAYSEKEAAAHIGKGVTMVSPMETDISLFIPDHYIRNGERNYD